VTSRAFGIVGGTAALVSGGVAELVEYVFAIAEEGDGAQPPFQRVYCKAAFGAERALANACLWPKADSLQSLDDHPRWPISPEPHDAGSTVRHNGEVAEARPGRYRWAATPARPR
jgi:hypothetical protein